MAAILGQDCSLVIQPFLDFGYFCAYLCHLLCALPVRLWSLCRCHFGGIWRLLLVLWELWAHWFVLGSMLLVQDPEDVDRDRLQVLPVVRKMRLPVLTFLQHHRLQFQPESQSQLHLHLPSTQSIVMIFFHLFRFIHLHDLQLHLSLPKTTFHLQVKQPHASFIQTHFHLKDVANVIIDPIEALPCLHLSPSPRQSPCKKLLDTLHLLHHPPDLWHLQFDLQSENHLSDLLPRSISLLRPNHQPLPDRLKNLNLPSSQILNIPTSIKPPLKSQMSARTSPSIKHHFNLRYVTRFNLVQKQFQNFRPLTPWNFKPESLCRKHVILPFHLLPSTSTSWRTTFMFGTPRRLPTPSLIGCCVSLDPRILEKVQPLEAWTRLFKEFKSQQLRRSSTSMSTSLRTPTCTTFATILSHPLQASIGTAFVKASTASLMVLVATSSLSKVTGCSNVIPSWMMQIISWP